MVVETHSDEALQYAHSLLKFSNLVVRSKTIILLHFLEYFTQPSILNFEKLLYFECIN
jgi:hypothetical protein